MAIQAPTPQTERVKQLLQKSGRFPSQHVLPHPQWQAKTQDGPQVLVSLPEKLTRLLLEEAPSFHESWPHRMGGSSCEEAAGPAARPTAPHAPRRRREVPAWRLQLHRGGSEDRLSPPYSSRQKWAERPASRRSPWLQLLPRPTGKRNLGLWRAELGGAMRPR